MIEKYLKAVVPCVAYETQEDQRLIAAITNEIAEINKTSQKQVRLWKIAADAKLDIGESEAKMSYSEAFAKLDQQTSTVLIVRDFQSAIKTPQNYRALANSFMCCRKRMNRIILIAPLWAGVIPPEVEKEIVIDRFATPTAEEFNTDLKLLEESLKVKAGNDRSKVLAAAKGLTYYEWTSVASLSAIEHNAFLAREIERSKCDRINASGVLSVQTETNTASDIGGLDLFKRYVAEEIATSIDIPELAVKGLLLSGPPGTGKSAAAAAVGNIIGSPLIRMNPAWMKGRYVGESEGNMKRALEMVRAFGRSVVMLDEVDKAFPVSSVSGQSDGGSTAGMLSMLLTYMQESKGQTIFVFTCNRHELIPSELTRKGRIDSSWFVDIPTAEATKEIAAIHCRKVAKYSRFKGIEKRANDIARLCRNYTGAEIEEVVKSLARQGGSFEETMPAIIEASTPWAESHREYLKEMREWAKVTMRPATSAESQPQSGNPYATIM